MAIDLNKEVRLPFSKSVSEEDYPSKTTMNLMVTEKRRINGKQALTYGIVGLVVLVVVGKFAIFDQFAGVAAAQNAYDSNQAALDVANEKLADYDQVLEEFNKYAGGTISGTGPSTALSTSELFNLLDTCVVPNATVSTVQLTESDLKVSVVADSLDKLAALDSALKANEKVADVTVETASNPGSSGTTAAINIKLNATKG